MKLDRSCMARTSVFCSPISCLCRPKYLSALITRMSTVAESKRNMFAYWFASMLISWYSLLNGSKSLRSGEK